MKPIFLSAVILGLGAAPAAASSPDAWDEFAATMERECRAMVEGELADVTVRVDPFGSETYGLAIVSGIVGEAPVERICVMDKQSQAVEIGGELPESQQPGGPLAFLAQEDRDALETMEETARTTLSEIEGSGEQLDPAAMDAANVALSGLATATTDRLSPGSYACTVYWYGFLDQGARRVGQHQCRISEAETGIIVEKISGERFAINLIPAGERLAYAGRTFLEGQPENAYDAENPANAGNANFGNKVGLAANDEGKLYLLSTQARGMQPPDPIFFEIVVLTP